MKEIDFDPELVGGLGDGMSKFSGEDYWTIGTRVIDIVFTGTGIVAADDVIVVFIDKHRSCAEHDEVEIEDGEGVVEIRLGKD